LSKHGLIRPARCKETQFFRKSWLNLENASQQLPAMQADGGGAFAPTDDEPASATRLAAFKLVYSLAFQQRKRDQPCFVSVEGTPGYIRSPALPAMVHSILPNVMLVSTIRHPGRRVVSQFSNEHAHKKTSGA
jgi:hypothetical protein